MKAVRLTRANGLNDRWIGDKDAIRILEDEDAADIVERLLAVYAPEYDPQEVTRPLGDVAGDVQEAVHAQQDAVQQLTGLAEELSLYEDADSEPELKRPYGNHSKAAWTEWALHGDHGQPRPTAEEAAGLTKNELMNRYGERL